MQFVCPIKYITLDANLKSLQIEKLKWMCRKWKLVFSAFNMDLPMWLLQSWQPQKLKARHLFFSLSRFAFFLQRSLILFSFACKFPLLIYLFELKIRRIKYYICFPLNLLFIYLFFLHSFNVHKHINIDWQFQYLIIL